MLLLLLLLLLHGREELLLLQLMLLLLKVTRRRGAVEGVVTVGCSGRVVRLLRGRGNDNELTYGQRCSGRACINIHLEAARGRGPPRPAPSFVPSFLPSCQY